MQRLLERWGDRLVSKLMGEEEAARLPASDAERGRAVARAIALKEAASKALGTGWSHGVYWRDVVATADPAAGVTLEGGAARRAARLGSTGTSAWIERRGDLVIAEVWLLR